MGVQVPPPALESIEVLAPLMSTPKLDTGLARSVLSAVRFERPTSRRML
ncbi:MAG: hypothetical protein M3071_06420 [Actinomycetota bacterium]|nr:hypothetical protein [Actinomycetota bacterium]